MSIPRITMTKRTKLKEGRSRTGKREPNRQYTSSNEIILYGLKFNQFYFCIQNIEKYKCELINIGIKYKILDFNVYYVYSKHSAKQMNNFDCYTINRNGQTFLDLIFTQRYTSPNTTTRYLKQFRIRVIHCRIKIIIYMGQILPKAEKN